MYFVHSDCLAALDLSITVKNESERKLYAVAIVESKEYCYAKRVCELNFKIRFVPISFISFSETTSRYINMDRHM